jgi:nicotinate phosphoribosyltransferase
MNPLSSPLLTDLYQLAMLKAYVEQRHDDIAVFEFFVRKLPPGRNFLLAAGLEQALEFLQNLRFGPEELEWLAQRFPPHVVRYCERLRFSGDVHAMPEGTPFLPDEPIMRVTAPLPIAQLVETRLINLLQLQTLIASKAARMVLAAPGKLLVDYGLRRSHGAEAGLLAARAAYLAGFSGTATVLANVLFAIPIFGTMAHSFIQSYDDEVTAFTAFARSHPENTVLLIDTYDTEAAARKVVKLAQQLRAERLAIKAVRIDSGDLNKQAARVRHILDAGGQGEVLIFVSGNLDENRLAELIGSGAPIDGFGVGTALTTSSDAPALDCVYKLQEYAGTPRRKKSEGKATWPGRKQVYRVRNDEGTMSHDLLALEDEMQPPSGEPLIVKVMENGKRLFSATPLEELRDRTLAEYPHLPRALRSLEQSEPYRVDVSERLRALAAQL